MSQKSPQSPLALQWLVFIRDHGVDLKISKEARVLASVLPTYGQGKNIFVTMKGLSKILPMKRDTIIAARQELEDKGLLEDITGKPKSEKQERTYRLTLPGYVEEGRLAALQVSPERDTTSSL